MKSKYLIKIFTVSFLILGTVQINPSSARADDEKANATKDMAESCVSHGPGCDTPSCIGDAQTLGIPIPYTVCDDGTTCGVAPSGGAAGAPGSPSTSAPGAGAAAAPGGTGSAGALTPDFSCPLVVKDNYADEMKKIMADIKRCPDIGSTNTIDNYLSNYVHRDMSLDNGMTCDNYKIRLPADLTIAKSLPTTLNTQPNNAYAACWVSQYNSENNQTTYVLTDPSCFETSQAPLLSSMTEYCGKVRGAEFNQQNVTNAIQSVTNTLSNSSNPACKDVVPAAVQLVSGYLGTTPAGIIGVVGMQLLSKTIDTLVNHSQSNLKNYLAEQDNTVRRESNACHYYNLSQGILGCARFADAPPVPTAANACMSTPDELKPAFDVLTQLQTQLTAVETPLGTGNIDLKDPKAANVLAANQVLTPKFFTDLKNNLNKKVTLPNGKQDTIMNYLTGLATKPALDTDDPTVIIARQQLQGVLNTVNESRDLLIANKGGQVQKDFITALERLGGDSNQPYPLDLTVLTNSEVGFGLVAAHDASAASQKAASQALADTYKSLKTTYDASIKQADQAKQSAEKDLNLFAVDKQKVKDLKDFVQKRVTDYTNLSKIQDQDPTFSNTVKQEAIQACAALAPSFYYTGDPKGFYEDNLSKDKSGPPNEKFGSDYSSVCGPLFPVAPALKNLVGANGPDQAKNFKKSVCAATKAAQASLPTAAVASAAPPVITGPAPASK